MHVVAINLHKLLSCYITRSPPSTAQAGGWILRFIFLVRLGVSLWHVDAPEILKVCLLFTQIL